MARISNMPKIDKIIADRMLDLLGEYPQITFRDLQCELHITEEIAWRHIQYLRVKGYAHVVDPYADEGVAAMTWAAGRGYRPQKGTEQPETLVQVTTRHWPRRINFQVSDIERLLFPSYGLAA